MRKVIIVGVYALAAAAVLMVVHVHAYHKGVRHGQSQVVSLISDGRVIRWIEDGQTNKVVFDKVMRTRED